MTSRPNCRRTSKNNIGVMIAPERQVIIMITVVGLRGQEWKIKSATANGVTFVRHEDLEEMAVKEGVKADYDSLGEDERNAYAGCTVYADGIMHYGMASAPTMQQAFSLAYDDAIIDLYGLNAKSYHEYLLRRTAEAKKDLKNHEAV